MDTLLVEHWPIPISLLHLEVDAILSSNHYLYLRQDFLDVLTWWKDIVEMVPEQFLQVIDLELVDPLVQYLVHERHLLLDG